MFLHIWYNEEAIICHFLSISGRLGFSKKVYIIGREEEGSGEEQKRKEKVVSVYGYARVSAGKSLKTQVKALSEAVKEENIVTDAAGTNAFCALLGRLQAGDLLVVPSLEALGGSYEAVLQAWKQVTGMGADIRVLDLPLLDTRKNAQVSGIVQQVLGFAAERDKKRTCLQAQGIAAAKERGVRFGRPCVEYTEEFIAAAEAFRKRQITLPQALERTGVKKSAFYYHLKKLEELGLIHRETAAVLKI